MELDTNWISEFDIDDKHYKHFYKEKVESIKIYFLYINRNQELFHIKKEKYAINNSTLTKENLIQILNKYKTYEKKSFIPLSILKYNITLNPEYINKFLNDPSENYKFLEPQNNIEEISWFDSIIFFHNINSLYIVYREKLKSKHNNTKKIYIRKKLNRKKTKKRHLKI